MTNPWSVSTYDASLGVPQQDILAQLRNDSAAVVVLKNAVPKHALHNLAQEVCVRRDRATVTSYGNGALTTLGCYLAKHLKHPSVYFDSAAAGIDLFDSQTVDVREMVRSQLRRMLRLDALEVAAEADGRMYSPAVIRIHGDGIGNPLHNDNIMRDAAGTGLMLAGLKNQFSCITCLQECDMGGELLHYKLRWQPEHEQFKVQGGLGYHQAVVANAEVCRFRPEAGDVYLIDPTNFHAIEPVIGKDRITLGSFFGFRDEDCRHGVCWS